MLAMDANEAKVLVEGWTGQAFGCCVWDGFGCRDQTITDGAKLDRLATSFLDCVFTGDRDTAAFAAFAPLDVVSTFRMCFDGVVDADTVFEAPFGSGTTGAKRQRLSTLIFLTRLTRSAYSGAFKRELRVLRVGLQRVFLRGQ